MMEQEGISGKTIVVIISIVAIILLGIIPSYTKFNLKKYSIWYAQRMPHAQGTDPVLAMVGKNLSYINIPDDTEKRRSILDPETYPELTIEEKNESGNWEMTVGINGGSYLSLDFYSNGEFEISYLFNRRGELNTIQDRTGEYIHEFTEEEKEEAYERAYAVIQPFIDKQFFPIINMQGTFDREYQLQFK